MPALLCSNLVGDYRIYFSDMLDSSTCLGHTDYNGEIYSENLVSRNTVLTEYLNHIE